MKIIFVVLSCLVVTDCFATPHPWDLRQECWVGCHFFLRGSSGPGSWTCYPIEGRLCRWATCEVLIITPELLHYFKHNALWTKLPPFWQTWFSVAFLHKLSPLVQPDSPSITPLCLIPNLPIFKCRKTLILPASSLEVLWPVLLCHPSEPLHPGESTCTTQLEEPAFICTSAWPMALRLPLQEAKILVFGCSLWKKWNMMWNWWNWELTKSRVY